jgi:hypothetical protein
MNSFNAEERASLRMKSWRGLKAALDESIENFDALAKAKLGNVSIDEIDLESVITRATDKVYMDMQRTWQNLELGGCGDIEETICKKGNNKDGYNAENCKACQERFVAMRDEDLDKEKACGLEESLKNPANLAKMTKEQIIAEYDTVYANLKKMYRRYPNSLPTLLRESGDKERE